MVEFVGMRNPETRMRRWQFLIRLEVHPPHDVSHIRVFARGKIDYEFIRISLFWPYGCLSTTSPILKRSEKS
jgi:hypothetical protein